MELSRFRNQSNQDITYKKVGSRASCNDCQRYHVSEFVSFGDGQNSRSGAKGRCDKTGSVDAFGVGSVNVREQARWGKRCAGGW
jgi:hypothetical protein